MGQKLCFGFICVNFATQMRNVIISIIFRKDTRNSLFPQCKKSIGNNCGSVEDRYVKFAYSRGFSATAYRMVWPPSLLRDRKWPRPPIRRKTTPWTRSTLQLVVYKLELTIMGQRMCSASSASRMRYERKAKLIFSTILRKNTRNWGTEALFTVMHLNTVLSPSLLQTTS